MPQRPKWYNVLLGSRIGQPVNVVHDNGITLDSLTRSIQTKLHLLHSVTAAAAAAVDDNGNIL